MKPPPVARPGYDHLHPYAPGAELPCPIDLSDNTNRWGFPPCAAAALGCVDPLALTRYPSPYSDRLKTSIAMRLGVDPSMIVTGAGSDGVLEPAIRAFARDGGRMALADPTFVMAAPFGVTNGLTPVPVPLLPDYDVDAGAMLAVDGCVTYLCAPNNPTGTPVSRRALEAVVAGASGLVIIDEAYVEFSAANAADLARSSNRVLLLRTFSKAFGLAGLRVGYGIGSPGVVAAVEKARGPYTVGAIAESAAVAVLEDDSGWVETRIAAAATARRALVQDLRGMGLEPAPSEANFVFVPLRSARRMAVQLAARGIRFRAFVGLPIINAALEASDGEALRITVAPAEQLEPALSALRELVDAGELA